MTALYLMLIPAMLAAEPPRKPNVVFILADDLGINDLRCYQRKDQPTPNLDRLATQGLRFRSAYCAQPICSPSRAAVMTGKTPARLHITTFLPGRADCVSQKLLHPKIEQQLPLAEVTLAEYLKQAGYATACVGKWHLGGKGFLPGDQGFDVVHVGNANTKPSLTEGGKGEYDLTTRAIEFIEANQDRPFFLYVPHNNPHVPLAAKPELVEKHKDSFNPIYAAMITTLDDSVGKIVAKIDELKLGEDTIIVFTSDNGGLHVLESPNTPATHNTPFRAGKGFLYEGGLRIPLIVRWTGKIKPAQVSDVPVINTDWVPTFLELAGIETKTKFDGVSIAKLLKSEEMIERPFYWHFPHYTNQGSRPGGAMRDGDWKFIEHYEDGKAELFNLDDDIRETKNLAEQHPVRIDVMRKKLAVWRKSVGAQENVPNPDFDPAQHQKLYVDIDVSQLKTEDTAVKLRPLLEAWREGMNAVLPKKR